MDFVVEDRGALLCIEVKSGAKKTALPGIAKFLELYPHAKPLLVGENGIKVETFLSDNVLEYF